MRAPGSRCGSSAARSRSTTSTAPSWRRSRRSRPGRAAPALLLGAGGAGASSSSTASGSGGAAAAAWPEITKFAKERNLKIVSPAVNFCGGSCNVADPFDWLDQFFAACPGCEVDYIAMHWYACSKEALTWYLQKLEGKYAQPLWLTEFACLDDPGDHSAAGQSAYMKDALTILEADPRVFRYAWFTGRSDDAPAVDLLGKDGELTPLGQEYVGFPGACTP
jgi:putative glycosyl hydrolase